MRQFYGVNPVEYTFVNTAVRLGYSKTKGRKAFFAFRQIQNGGIESWEREHPSEVREWHREIIVAAGYQKIFEEQKIPNEASAKDGGCF